ncbi:hypothetical protein QC761_208530 [Podospora bellae-mahoneyi]|uniref:Flavin reductase like domain-containing protein n=1 Tax=Podospora bellae-mahoneyi TaxID=2093777 RepID=A0ABR0FRA9_9PEZI|nr:hypothetical protein QC761_208530 [Podospora bellae-mahoneyi]
MPARANLRIPFAPCRTLFHQPRVTSYLSSHPLSPIADKPHHQRLHNRLSLRLHIHSSSFHTYSTLASPLTMPKRKTTTTTTTTKPTTTRQSKRTKTTTPSSPPSSHPAMSPLPKASSLFTPLPPSKTNRLLEPGPILLVSTGNPQTQTHNLMTLGFHTMISHSSPTLIGLTLGPWDHSYSLLSSSKECVLSIPNLTLAKTVVDIGNISSSDLPPSETKWDRFKLDPIQGEKVSCALVGGDGIIGNLECKVEDESLVKKYNFWVLRVVKGWVNEQNFRLDGTAVETDKGKMMHHRGDGSFFVGGEEVLDLRGRMTKWRMLQD